MGCSPHKKFLESCADTDVGGGRGLDGERGKSWICDPLPRREAHRWPAPIPDRRELMGANSTKCQALVPAQTCRPNPPGWPVCKRGSWNWNCRLKNEPQRKHPVLPANPHFPQMTFGTPSNHDFCWFYRFNRSTIGFALSQACQNGCLASHFLRCNRPANLNRWMTCSRRPSITPGSACATAEKCRPRFS